jgi:hypothetical protein
MPHGFDLQGRLVPFSYPDLIKFPYLVDTTERGDRGAKADDIGGETEGNFTDNSNGPIWSFFIIYRFISL